jgi:hypothetical protein
MLCAANQHTFQAQNNTPRMWRNTISSSGQGVMPAGFLLQALGLLLLTLTCVGSGLRPSLDNCMANFSMDLTRIISALLASPEGGSTIGHGVAAATPCLPADLGSDI